MKNPKGNFEQAIKNIDALNAQDPNQEESKGETRPKELLYSQRMTQWLKKLSPTAPKHLYLAARAQHLCRWEIPRSDYPQGKTGYKKWRTTLNRFHAEKVLPCLENAGYDKEFISKTQSLIKKENLKSNPDTQLLEDVICLVFLEFYFTNFIKGKSEEAILTILRKTWKKMSEKGHQAALGLNFPSNEKHLIEKALAD